MNVAEFAAYLLKTFPHDLQVVTADDDMDKWYFANPKLVEIPKDSLQGNGYPIPGPAVSVD